MRPLLIAQATGGETVHPFLTDDALVDELVASEARIDCRGCAGVDHGSVPAVALDDALAFAERRLRR